MTINPVPGTITTIACLAAALFERPWTHTQ